ncbi:hypothetical protein [Streptomyces sp. NPDC101206]|uniref:hypothetical protein n=1 Tax=Streptomyces sp. NPDC101206 TaxID=3366128 RepID=UPI003822EF3F
MPKKGERRPWRLAFHWLSNDVKGTTTHGTPDEARSAAHEMFKTARLRDSELELTIENRDTGEKITMTATDALNEEITSSIERARSLAAGGEDHEAALADLVEETETLIKQISGKGSVKLKEDFRAQLLEAVKIPAQRAPEAEGADAANAEEDQPTQRTPEGDGQDDAADAEGDQPVTSAELVKPATTDVSEIVNFNSLLALGIKRVKEAAADSWEKGRGVGEVLLEMRLGTTDKHGDPDLGGRTDPGKKGAGAIYAAVVAGLPEEGEDEDADAIRDKIDSIQTDARRSLQNLVVEVVRALDVVPDDEEGKAKVEAERARFANAVAMFPEADKPFSEKVFDYYEVKGKPIPRLTRAEKARRDRAIKARHRAELEAAVAAGEMTPEAMAASLNPQPNPAEVRKKKATKAKSLLAELVEEARAIEDTKAKEKALDEISALLAAARKEVRNSRPPKENDEE